MHLGMGSRILFYSSYDRREKAASVRAVLDIDPQHPTQSGTFTILNDDTTNAA